MTCEIDVNTSISGNVISLTQPTFGAPIVLTGQITITGTGTQLPNIPVSSGVRFQYLADLNHLIIGGVGSETATFTNGTNYKGIKYNESVHGVLPVTNLNQLSACGELSGSKFTYFAVSISG